MADILTPALGESVTEATIAKWTKKVGDPVKKDELLVELETDKVSLEVVSPADGTLGDIKAAEGKAVDDVYILRLEQFYPWPMKSVCTELSRFPNAELVWCQEEPKNMGGWTFVDPWLELTLAKIEVKAKRARYVGRPASASTAAGLMSRHLKELDAFLTEAFA